MMKVPFLNLKAQYDAIAQEIDAAIKEVIANCAFSGGPYVERFEEDFAKFCGASYAVGVSSGTEALWLALMGLGVQPGDEVITAPNSFIATAEAISLCGAEPVFVDVEERSYTINPALIEEAITPKTKVIIPVHLFGQTADMDPILKIARKHGLAVVEDACQAHGAEYKGKRAGSIGDAGCFSFYPGKNLGAYGEAGGVVTNDRELVDRIRLLRDHGQARKYHHEVVGTNGRMDGIQGAILTVKLRHLCSWNEARRHHAAAYNQLLDDIVPITTPDELPYARHVFHIYAIRAPRREQLIECLGGKGIGCGVHYPVPIHLQRAYASQNLQLGAFPVAERAATEFISLPMFAELTSEQIAYVCNELKTSSAELG
jgi:dTDP-4-amino-4,6-dideoxygalactose transaminase